MRPIEKPRRRDPAPSRWAFRLHRWWLTPAVRRFARVGVPALISICACTYVFSQPHNRTVLRDMVAEIRRTIAERPEFMVNLMAIDGASEELAIDIREILPLDFPVSSFDLDLKEMRAIVEDLDAIASADLRIRPGGILQLDITERVPALVWRTGSYLELLDGEGRRIAALPSRDTRPDLPLIAGAGADRAAAEALALMSAARPIADRVRGLVRVGERRWNVVLDRNQRILLPATDAFAALEQVVALNQAQDLLARDVRVIDMRVPDRPTLRISDKAVTSLLRIRGVTPTTGEEQP
ncbi:MAG: cell division protein FtsQ/DivIB [Pseudomonadota bacterium]